MSERTSEGQGTNKAVGDKLCNTAYVSLSASEVRELIASRAYELYEQRGTDFGDELSDWLNAEAEVVTMLLAEPQRIGETERPNGRPPIRTRKATSVRKRANGARPQVSRLSERKNASKGDPA